MLLLLMVVGIGFSLISFLSLRPSKWNSCNPKWNSIWSLPIQERIKYFLWLSIRDKLFSNLSRWHRNLTDNPASSICGAVEKSSIHILGDCKDTKFIWMSTIRPAQYNSFFSLPTEDWILVNIQSNNLFAGTGIPWKIMFSSITWQVLKRRNSTIFTGQSQSTTALLGQSKSWASYCLSGHPQMDSCFPLNTIQEEVRWLPAPTSWVTLNSDGSVSTSSSITSAGGLIGDSHGNWLVDCSEAFKLVTSPTAYSCPLALVRAISHLISRAWCVDFTLIRREANFPADFITKMSHPTDGSTAIFSIPPHGLHNLLSRDLYGPP
ncbi:hypothetical protein F3Y22_tig00117034pilonHSYRG00573 [Hibiscus syriacus]|uniref:Reverse transcriptase zinc-binding domain-containing protein n=1 Tax=Hibiscus syriacus TaxID=106335 RepID=A0A6A2WAF2_HIBSY|nr:hypothetical protein F3Y22_tig00117034pilonHSYRG00573 [Hibiscus syriacus]